MSAVGFVWENGDFTDEVTIDTRKGIYLEDATIPASCGCWVRIIEGAFLPEWFGVKADGVTDDTEALQAALDVISYLGGGRLIVRKTPVISAPLVYSPKMAIGDSTAGSDLLFARLPVLDLVGFGGNKIIAAAPMEAMFRIKYGAGEPAPNQCLIENIELDCADLAEIGILSEWPLGTQIKRCRIKDAETGIRIYGRGGAYIADNHIRAKTGISLTRGGDTVMERNHIFLRGEAGSVRTAIYFGAWSGNSRANNNTIQAEQTDNVDHINTRGFWIDGWATDTVGASVAKGVRDVLAQGNEFHGIETCVFADSDTHDIGAGVCTINLVDNHAMQGWWGSTQLIYARNIVGLTIKGGDSNVVGTASTKAAAQFDHCDNVDFMNSCVSNVTGTNAVLVTGWSTNIRIDNVKFINAVHTADAVIYVGDATNVKVRKCSFRQSSGFTALGVTEAGAAGAGNIFTDNDFDASFSTPYWTANPNTVAQRIETSMWYPTDSSRGAWRKGDKVYLMTPTPGGSVGYVCTTGGAPGVWKGFGTIAP